MDRILCTMFFLIISFQQNITKDIWETGSGKRGMEVLFTIILLQSPRPQSYVHLHGSRVARASSGGENPPLPATNLQGQGGLIKKKRKA